MNAWYDEGLRQFGLGSVAWKTAGGSAIKALLIDTAAYTVDLATDATLADIPAGARVGSPAAMVLIDAAAGGVLDANDLSITGLVGTPTVEALVVFHDTGVEGTSTLLLYIDDATGLPVPGGVAQVNVAWNNGANKIARL